MTGIARAGRIGEQAVVDIILQDGTKAQAPVFVLIDPTGNSFVDANGVMMQGNVASGFADVGRPIKMGAVYNASLPSLASGQRGDLQIDASGLLRVLLANVTTLNGASDGVATGNAGLTTVSYPLKFNGTTHDRDRKPNIVSRLIASAGTGSPTLVKNSPADVTSWWGQNGAAITYLQVYNKASTPVIGTDTPAFTFPIAANAPFSRDIPNGGIYLSNGAAYAFTTDAAGATAAAASAVTSFAMLAA